PASGDDARDVEPVFRPVLALVSNARLVERGIVVGRQVSLVDFAKGLQEPQNRCLRPLAIVWSCKEQDLENNGLHHGTLQVPWPGAPQEEGPNFSWRPGPQRTVTRRRRRSAPPENPGRCR